MEIFAEFNWIEVVKYVLFALVGGLVVYCKGSPKLQDKAKEAESWLDKLRGYAAEYIARAEAEYQGTKRGGEKFNWVVDRLYSILPAAVKPFIGKETIADIVQGVFDSITAYATIQMDRWVDAATGRDDDAAADNAV